MSQNPYRNKTAFVTGAGSGIGLALCEDLARRGAFVFATDIHEESAQKTLHEIQSRGGQGQAFALDVRDEKAFDACVKKAHKKRGRLDYLFNNAGTATAGEVKHNTPQDWKRVLDVNLMGVIHGIHAAYPFMIEQGHGHIVNTGSLGGLIPMPGGVSYAASKFAVVGLSLALRGEAHNYGVKVSVLCPSIVDTAIYETAEKRGMSATALRDNLMVDVTSAAQCADEALAGVARNEAVILVPGHAKVFALAYRLLPEATRWFANKVFEKSRGQEKYKA